MKSILFFVLFIPFLAVAQSSSTSENEFSAATLKKSAEDFVLNWFNRLKPKAGIILMTSFLKMPNFILPQKQL